jgi:hypothetical protein
LSLKCNEVVDMEETPPSAERAEGISRIAPACRSPADGAAQSELVLGQVDTDDDGYVLVDHPTTHTNIPGVFACGDLVDHRYRQAITAAGTGCAAAGDAEHLLAASGLATYTQEETASLDIASAV